MQEATTGVPNERTNLGNSARLLHRGEILLLLNAHVHEYTTGTRHRVCAVRRKYSTVHICGVGRAWIFEASAFRSLRI